MPQTAHHSVARHARARPSRLPAVPALYAQPPGEFREVTRRSGLFLVMGVMIVAFAVLLVFYLKMM